MELYRLLPSVIKELDRRASSIVSLQTDEPFWKKALYMLEQDCTDLESLISGLEDLFKADLCDSSILTHISEFLGSIPPGFWSEERKRMFLTETVKLYKIGGTVTCWKSLLGLLGYSESVVYELWKDEVYATTGYDAVSGSYMAARVDLSAVGSIIGPNTFSEIQRLLFDRFRPVHVLVRQTCITNEYEDYPADEAEEDGPHGAAGLGILEEPEDASDVSMYVSVECVRMCEVGCETSCEYGCEYCETSCEIGCESGCEVIAEVLFTGTIVAIDPATFGPISLAITDGVMYSGDPLSLHTGSVSFTEISTFGPVTLEVTNGLVEEGYEGDVAAVDASTGDTVTLSIRGGYAYAL